MPASPGLHGFDACVQTAFMTGGLVGMDQFFADGRINARLGQLECIFCCSLVPRMNRFDHRFDSRTQFCALTHIVLAVLDRLTCTLSC